MVGGQGTILQSGIVPGAQPVALLGPYRYSSRGFEFNLKGETGRSYRVQASTNLTMWTDLVSVTNNQPIISLVDATATQHRQRFHRVFAP